MHRLEKQFHVHSLGKDYFGEDIFEQCALTDTSTLYIFDKVWACAVKSGRKDRNR